MEVKKMFERAGDSVSKFAKSVGDNSKKAATKMKLNRNIHDLEKVKETAYTEMGKQYFLSHADAAEEPYAEDCRSRSTDCSVQEGNRCSG